MGRSAFRAGSTPESRARALLNGLRVCTWCGGQVYAGDATIHRAHCTRFVFRLETEDGRLLGEHGGLGLALVAMRASAETGPIVVVKYTDGVRGETVVTRGGTP